MLYLLPLVALVVEQFVSLLPVQFVTEMHEGRVEDYLVIREVQEYSEPCKLRRLVTGHVTGFAFKMLACRLASHSIVQLLAPVT